MFFPTVWHTKFAPNWWFGLMKQQSKIRDLDDIANCISLSLVNAPQLVGSLDGITFISTYNYIQHFEEWTISSRVKNQFTQRYILGTIKYSYKISNKK